MKRVLVTGGLGFLGSHLVEHLLDKGYSITIIDNLSTNAVAENFFSDFGDKVKVITKSIQDVDFTSLDSHDYVYHLACVVGPSGVLKHAGVMGLNILIDTKLLTDYCIMHNAKFIDISTSEVYGQTGALREETHKHVPGDIAIRTEYGAGKLLGEIQTINKARVEPKLKYHIIRPFNISGPRQKPDNGFVLPRFVIAGLTNQPITVFGDGSQERAFTYVKDMAEAIILIAESHHVNEIWNIGNPDNRTTILELANMVKNEVYNLSSEYSSEIVFVDGKAIHGPLFEEVPDKLPEIIKIRSKLGWEPKVSLQQVVKETVDYYHPLVKNGLQFKIM